MLLGKASTAPRRGGDSRGKGLGHPTLDVISPEGREGRGRDLYGREGPEHNNYLLNLFYIQFS